MTENETNKLREALDLLLELRPNDDAAPIDLIKDYAYRTGQRELMPNTCNAARVVARFLGWDDVPEGEIT